MPIYEYSCRDCERIFQTLVLRQDELEDIFCPFCGGIRLERLLSRVAYHRSENDRLSEFEPESRQSESFYRDTRNIGLSAKKRAQGMGVDLGTGFESKLEKLRSDPGSVIKESE